jgi:hypothetical protein
MNKNGMRRMIGAAGITAALLLALAAAPAGAQTPGFMTGKVKATTGATLAAREDAARREAGNAGYFTAWMFESRNKIHSHGKIVETYSVGAEGAKIKVRSRDKSDVNGFSGDDKDTPSPAALLLLHDATGTVVDASVLDPEQTYEFAPTPVFWLGQAGNEDSCARIEAVFAKSKEDKLKTTLLFLASLHSGPRGYGFVKSVAQGSEPAKVREQAVFWLGASQDTRAVADLKAIYAKEKVVAVKKQIVFGLQLNKTREATAELIALAKTEPDREVRKTAVFWLGQKASEESVGALKDIVQAKDGEASIKEQAVFAISQLPKDKSVPMLIDIAKTNRSADVRKKAIFWLGQSGDDSAVKFFEDILLKK